MNLSDFSGLCMEHPKRTCEVNLEGENSDLIFKIGSELVSDLTFCTLKKGIQLIVKLFHPKDH